MIKPKHGGNNHKPINVLRFSTYSGFLDLYFITRKELARHIYTNAFPRVAKIVVALQVRFHDFPN